MNRTRKAAVACAVATLGLAPPALAAPAHATRTSDGCTVTPETPVFEGEFTDTAVPYVVYRINVTCSAGVTVETEQVRKEQDLWNREGHETDDTTGSSNHDWDFTAGGGTKSIGVRRGLVTTSNEGDSEEPYQQVRFKVTAHLVGGGQVAGSWTDWDFSGVASIHH
jgi:hypothetical protein